MPKLGDRPGTKRGDRRREQLVNAGVALLREQGWSAVTTRGVAERAGTNAGLIHYHFGGLPRLHEAIARRAGDLVIKPVVSEILGAADERAALEAVRRLLPETTGDERATRLAVELIAGAMRDPALGEVLRDQLREVRALLGDRLGVLHPGWSAARRSGAATLITALIDGLILHYLLDPGLPIGDALTAAGDIVREKPA